MKRTVDLVGAVFLLLLLWPLMLIIATLVRLTSPGPVIFKQERAGFRLTSFTIYKFRTMVRDADSITICVSRDDPRVTKLGRFLRSTHLDELPQLINVLRGEMSLVGPRPLHWHIVGAKLETTPCYLDRFEVKPGLTGLEQIRSRSERLDASSNSAFETDRVYIAQQSLFLDISILVTTARLVFTRHGT